MKTLLTRAAGLTVAAVLTLTGCGPIDLSALPAYLRARPAFHSTVG